MIMGIWPSGGPYPHDHVRQERRTPAAECRNHDHGPFPANGAAERARDHGCQAEARAGQAARAAAWARSWFPALISARAAGTFTGRPANAAPSRSARSWPATASRAAPLQRVLDPGVGGISRRVAGQRPGGRARRIQAERVPTFRGTRDGGGLNLACPAACGRSPADCGRNPAGHGRIPAACGRNPAACGAASPAARAASIVAPARPRISSPADPVPAAPRNRLCRFPASRMSRR